MLEALCCILHWWQDLMMIMNLNCSKASLLSWISSHHPFSEIHVLGKFITPIVSEASFLLFAELSIQTCPMFHFSSNMQAVMFMTCWQCSQSTWICHQFCTCWTWFPSCLQWLTHDRLFTLLLFWSELSGRQDYPLLLLSLVHLPTQTALFMGQWLLVSDISWMFISHVN